MSVDFLRLLFDVGLVVLIWMVQLVIYPSFKFYGREQLNKWHPKYTRQVTFVVMPLMLGQLVLASYQLWLQIDWYTIISLILIFFNWLLTFILFVPLHNRISADNYEKKDLKKLVFANWWRTAVWSIILLMSVVYFLG